MAMHVCSLQHASNQRPRPQTDLLPPQGRVRTRLRQIETNSLCKCTTDFAKGLKEILDASKQLACRNITLLRIRTSHRRHRRHRLRHPQLQSHRASSQNRRASFQRQHRSAFNRICDIKTEVATIVWCCSPKLTKALIRRSTVPPSLVLRER